jgi:hypothetical protein
MSGRGCTATGRLSMLNDDELIELNPGLDAPSV